ncbi:prolyl 4-hydroxylase subunit alpha [Marinobacterium zhoushanense]|uniref:Prolyl 4-hydroxylase subunit alpha n=1 Tax=Marinobacterium zhoushanense TaxID=1679163 RepID=A0ABQ1KJL7_9GAMM|nr:2OG-Fe(II) oxygenase [Marinobacterium zhoushanense]GGB97973.1 prolyl 4-hydroxylase subunit alpha [Marinobacterium zhoushanense]
MNSIPNTPDEALLDRIADALVNEGYIICDQAIDSALTLALLQRIQQLDELAFQRAGVGREQDQQLNAQIRRDQIRWLDTHDAREAAYLSWMDQLRNGLNRRLFMGLFDYECHFAHYAPGAFYKRHLDAFRGQTNRILTTVFYLNTDWQGDDGGELLLYPGQGDCVLERVAPQARRLVVFLSDRFPHEVLPARTDRYSIAGWFRVNASIGNQIDPPR